MSTDRSPEPTVPVRISGNATAEEVAAVLAVLSRATGAPAAPEPPTSRWGHPAELVRRRLQPGPDAWYYSARPMTVMG